MFDMNEIFFKRLYNKGGEVLSSSVNTLDINKTLLLFGALLTDFFFLLIINISIIFIIGYYLKNFVLIFDYKFLNI